MQLGTDTRMGKNRKVVGKDQKLLESDRCSRDSKIDFWWIFTLQKLYLFT